MNGIPQLQSQYVANTQKSQDDLTKIKNYEQGVPKGKAWEVSQDFASILTNMMLKEMRQSLNEEEDPMYGGFSEQVWKDMLFDEYSKALTKNSLSPLVKMIYDSISRNQG